MRPTVMLMDYGVGNLHSLEKALVAAGADVEVTDDSLEALGGTALVLPGVGAFEPAAEVIARERGALRHAIQGGYPTLGICLGMQLLFDESEEGPGMGLGVFTGRVTRMRSARIPQIGWNAVDGEDPLLATSGLCETYYANSFACRPAEPAVVRAWSTHDGDRFPALVRQGKAIGVQFHPEKSSAPGVAFLRAWVEEVTP